MNTPVPHRVVLLAALFAGRDLNVCGGDCKSQAVGCQQRLPEKGAGGGVRTGWAGRPMLSPPEACRRLWLSWDRLLCRTQAIKARLINFGWARPVRLHRNQASG